MGSLCRVGTQEFEGRKLFVLSARFPGDIPPAFDLPSPYFAGLIAWDATAAGDDVIRSVAERLVAAGCAYACCWGPDCERVHDMIDQVNIERDPRAERVVMTTWHEKDSLAYTLWFLLNVSWPDPAYEAGCGCSVAVSIGSKEWDAEIRSALADPSALDSRFVGSDDEPG
jgi:hypothetical protein